MTREFKSCWCCPSPGVFKRNGRYFCYPHLPQSWDEVTLAHVQAARVMLRNHWEMSDIAERLNVSKGELDASLWKHIHVPTSRHPIGMF